MSFAGSPSPDAPARADDRVPDLRALVDYWLPRLRLGHWKILSVEYRRRFDELAHVTFDRQHRVAWITIRHPDDWHDEAWSVDRHGVELALLHELGHLVFEPLALKEGRKAAVEEQIVSAYAEALVAARYDAERKGTVPCP